MDVGPNGLIFVGWVSGRNCAYSVSTDGGETWGGNFTVSTQANSGSAFAGDTAVAVDDVGNLYAVCQDYASGGLGTNYVLLGHSKDKGVTWSEFTRVNQSLDAPPAVVGGDDTPVQSRIVGMMSTQLTIPLLRTPRLPCAGDATISGR